MTAPESWYYLKKCPRCPEVVNIAADPGVSPSSPGPIFRIDCRRCGTKIELTGGDLRPQKE